MRPIVEASRFVRQKVRALGRASKIFKAWDCRGREPGYPGPPAQISRRAAFPHQMWRGSNQGRTRSRVDAAKAGDRSLIFPGWLVQDVSMRWRRGALVHEYRLGCLFPPWLRVLFDPALFVAPCI